MRCHICNSELPSVNFNRDHGDIDPCPTCIIAISEVFTDPVPEEDLRSSEIEPTADELMRVVEDIQFNGGRFDVV